MSGGTPALRRGRREPRTLTDIALHEVLATGVGLVLGDPLILMDQGRGADEMTDEERISKVQRVSDWLAEQLHASAATPWYDPARRTTGLRFVSTDLDGEPELLLSTEALETYSPDEIIAELENSAAPQRLRRDPMQRLAFRRDGHVVVIHD